MARRKIDIENDVRVVRHNALVEQPISQAKQQQVSRDIIDERLSIKNTSIMDMIGTLTKVTWFHIVTDSKESNYAINTNPINGIAYDDKKFDVYRNFEIKFQEKIDNSDEGDQETIRSYITEGNLVVMPRTIKPYENDMFAMMYLDKLIIYRITSVRVQTMESDPGFNCSFTQFKSDQYITVDDFIETLNVNNDYYFHHELVGSSYRPIITYSEEIYLSKLRKLYEEIGKIFIQNCYDETYNTYFLKYCGEDVPKITNNNNIKVRPLPNADSNKWYQWGLSYHDLFTEDLPLSLYDNLLCYFIKRHGIFKNINGTIYVPDTFLPLYEGMYSRSIFSAIEERDKTRFKNKNTFETSIKVQEPGISSMLIGRYNISHLDGSSGSSAQLLSPTLVDLIVSAPSSLNTPFNQKVYENYSSLIAEIIAIYVLKASSDLREPLMTLHDNISELYSDNVKSENIFYLYPMLGYVISKTLENAFKDKR